MLSTAQLVAMCNCVGLDFSYLILQLMHCTRTVTGLSKAKKSNVLLIGHFLLPLLVKWQTDYNLNSMIIMGEKMGENAFTKPMQKKMPVKARLMYCQYITFHTVSLSIWNPGLSDWSINNSLATTLFFSYKNIQSFFSPHMQSQANEHFFSKHTLSPNRRSTWTNQWIEWNMLKSA